MARPRNPNLYSLNDTDFVSALEQHGSVKLAELLGVPVTTLTHRATALRKHINIKTPKKGPMIPKINEIPTEQLVKDVETLGLKATAKLYGMGASGLSLRLTRDKASYTPTPPAARSTPQRVNLDVENGVVLVFSDAHYWPGRPSVSHRALVRMAHEMDPAAIICNGDAVDMAAVSRHPPIGWEKQPTVQEEIETAQERLGEIIAAATKRTRRTWNLGNHDARFETRLATVAPEYAKLAGIHLHDHFPEWERAWSTWINDSVVIKHRYKGGVHAPHNNTVGSGKTMVTGHLHSAKVTPYTDYNGTRFGIDTGCLADTYGAQFVNYTEDNPLNWVSAFGVLTFRHGKLLWPELVVAFDDQSVQFRGKIIEV